MQSYASIYPHPLVTFLEGNSNSYLNHRGVETHLFVNRRLSISSSYPGSEIKGIKLYKVFADVWPFLELFPMSAMGYVESIGEDHCRELLEEISPEQCLDYFEQGKISVACLDEKEFTYELLFTKDPTGMRAEEEDSGKIFRVENKFSRPQDFISYTKEVYGIK